MTQQSGRLEGFKRFLRSTAVGVVATIVDLSLLLFLQNSLHFHAILAKTIALSCGILTQFFGNRSFAFKAGAGRVRRQLKWFLLVEAIAFVGTIIVYGLLFRWFTALAVRAQTPGKLFGIMPPEVAASLLSGFIVYYLFSYPLWNRVFKLTPEELAKQQIESAKQQMESAK